MKITFRDVTMMFTIILFSITSILFFYTLRKNSWFLPPKLESVMKDEKVIDNEDSIAELVEIIDELKPQFKKFRVFKADNIKIDTWSDGRKILVKLNGSIKSAENLFFDFRINSVLGEEVVIGMNPSTFWYWSKRDVNPALYYCAHEDIEKSRLKPFFNPFFLMMTFGNSIIGNSSDISNSDQIPLYEDENYYKIVYDLGEQGVFSVIFDKKERFVKSVECHNSTGEIMARSEITDRFNDGFPKKIIYDLISESKLMTLTFSSVDTNFNPKTEDFDLPNKIPKINMVDE